MDYSLMMAARLLRVLAAAKKKEMCLYFIANLIVEINFEALIVHWNDSVGWPLSCNYYEGLVHMLSTGH